MGDNLEYSRENDYLTVTGTDDTTQLIIKYAGNGKGYYSNYQGIYLPGDFPYYPVAGKQIIYDYEENYYYPVVPDNTPEYEIKVSSPLTIISNLESNGNNTFYGSTKVPCLFAGMYAEKDYMGMKLIYPYLDGESIHLDKILENTDTGKYSGKIVFVSPHTGGSYEEDVRIYDDAALMFNLPN